MSILFKKSIFYVLLLGFCIRLFACNFTFIVGPDGVHYINQAKAIYFGSLNNITASLGYLSNYSIFITGAYYIFHDWIIAARAVSLLFGFATLIPIYFLFKLFFIDKISSLGTLLFAFIPVFIGESADVMRGSVSYFFLALGLFHICKARQSQKIIFLFLSSLSLLMATWARAETFLFIIISVFYFLLLEKEKRFKKFFVFFSPVIFIIISGIVGASILGVKLDKLYRVSHYLEEICTPFSQYHTLRSDLSQLIISNRNNLLAFFLPEARNCIWLIVFGTVLNRMLEAFFYPLFIVFVIGLKGIGEKIKKDPLILYFSILAVSGIILLYFHTLGYWMIYYRFFYIVIFPSFIFAGFGLEKIFHFIQNKFNINEQKAFLIIGFLILAVTLPKNLQLRETDKIVFRQIGEFISNAEGDRNIVNIAFNDEIDGYTKMIPFYANLNYKGPVQPQDVSYYLRTSRDQDIQTLKEYNIKYLLWEEKPRNAEDGNFNISSYQNLFSELKQWYHPSKGKMILYKVNNDCF